MELRSGLYVVLEENRGISVFDGVDWVGKVENAPLGVPEETLFEFLKREARKCDLALEKERHFPWCFYLERRESFVDKAKRFCQKLWHSFRERNI